jgi:group I intron endonuclease
MTCSVYWIRCKDHTDMFSQGYIGVSKNSGLRFSQHQRRHENPHLGRAIAKYGWDNLVKTEILISDEAYCLDIEAKLRPTEKIGWNICVGGGMPPLLIGQTALIGATPWNKGKKYSDSTKKKISDAVRLAMQKPERKEVSRQLLLGKPSLMLGKKHTADTRAKMSLAKKGLPAKNKGMPITEEQKQKLIAAAQAYSWKCPHCQKEGFGRGSATRWHFDNCKQIGVAHGS